MAANIHPTAVIDPGAQIADGVEIGPYCCIGPEVVIGEGTRLYANVQIIERATIGKHNQIFPNAVIGGAPQDLGYKDEPTYVRIGDHNVIREFVTINRGTTKQDLVTVVGDHNLFMAYVHIAHDCKIGNHVVLANMTQLAGHVVIEDYVVSSAAVLVHQFCTIGTRCFLAGLALVKKDCVPGLMYYGDPAAPRALNLVGLKRGGYHNEELHHIKQAYKTLFREDMPIVEAVKKLETEPWANEPFVRHMIDRAKATVDSETSRSNQEH